MQNTSYAEKMSETLLRWYDENRRELPWRAAPGAKAAAYAVWLSEIMLQQTTVVAVRSYFDRFLSRWPTVTALAEAPLDDVLHAWAGLGYYARARNLHKCAQLVAKDYGGRFPDTEMALRALPGIGDYTAAAIAAIAFNRPAAAVDGNVIRVVSRLYGLTTPMPKVRGPVSEKTRALVPHDRPGDFAQAMMDLGATLCRPRKPDCGICPWSEECLAKAKGDTERFPVKPPKKEKPTRRGVAFWLQREDGMVLLERRPEKGLLGGMAGFPTTPWQTEFLGQKAVLQHAPGRTDWRALPGEVRHTFTHFHLELTVWTGLGPADRNDGIWSSPDDLDSYALPTVMKKVARHVVEG